MSQIGIFMIQTWALAADSLLAGLAVCPLLSWRGRIALSVLFGLCDGAANWIGSRLPHDVLVPPDIWLYAVCAIMLALAARRSGGWLIAMPFVLGLDNLASAAPASQAPSLAITSMVMALVGMVVSSAVARVARYGLRLIQVRSISQRQACTG